MFVAIVLTVQLSKYTACLIDRCYRPDISIGIWSFYLANISSIFASLALVSIMIWPAKFPAILAAFNVALFVVVTGLFWHANHEAHYLFAILFVAFTANAAILIARRVRLI